MVFDFLKVEAVVAPEREPAFFGFFELAGVGSGRLDGSMVSGPWGGSSSAVGVNFA